MVDGSYTAAADLYLGETSSQVIEFLATPRPAVFLNPARVAWATDPAYAQWACGPVIDDLADLLPALAAAPGEHPRYAQTQRAFAQASLGDTSGTAPARIVTIIRDLLADRSH